MIFTAEEKGLLGSRYFAGHPTVPESAIDADLNLDMFMPLFALKKLHVQGLDESTLSEDAKKVLFGQTAQSVNTAAQSAQ